ncbi:hypothetical protein SAMN04487951_106173 [Vreelandella arcis]|uniref:Uncharacterized protein n=1 Tax=Vreelandella arcis TaxID=416873 RepID=A0A1H0CRW3_9GAMM|nr:hypothetical protein SAMN04487951_106173 [Halomonas arcis]
MISSTSALKSAVLVHSAPFYMCCHHRQSTGKNTYVVGITNNGGKVRNGINWGDEISKRTINCSFCPHRSITILGCVVHFQCRRWRLFTSLLGIFCRLIPKAIIRITICMCIDLLTQRCLYIVFTYVITLIQSFEYLQLLWLTSFFYQKISNLKKFAIDSLILENHLIYRWFYHPLRTEFPARNSNK